MNPVDLPSKSTLYGVFLLGQAWVRGYFRSLQQWEREARALPTGLAAPRSLRAAVDALLDSGLAKETSEGIQLDEDVLDAGDDPSDTTLHRILLLLVERRRPTWLTVAVGTGGDVATELIPETASQRLHELGIDPAGPTGASWLPVLAGRPDIAARQEVGAAGEDVVVMAERARLEAAGCHELAAAVRTVSLVSDGFGYDVLSYEIDGRERWLEVKTMHAQVHNLFACFLTRNEARVGRAAPDRWRMVAVEYRAEGYRVVGEVSFLGIEPFTPVDRAGGAWVTAELRIPAPVFARENRA